jgi:hypothetical protein
MSRIALSARRANWDNLQLHPGVGSWPGHAAPELGNRFAETKERCMNRGSALETVWLT